MQKKVEKNKKKHEADTQVLDFNNPDYSFMPTGVHEWVQRGPYLVCKSCELEHGVYVGIHRRLITITTDGKPVLGAVK